MTVAFASSRTMLRIRRKRIVLGIPMVLLLFLIIHFDSNMKTVHNEVISIYHDPLMLPHFHFESNSKYISSNTDNFCNKRLNSTNQKVLSYCFYGAYARDFPELMDRAAGMINALDGYKGWRMRVYHDDGLAKERIEIIQNRYEFVDFCDISNLPFLGDMSGMLKMMWRFIPLGDPTVDVVNIRDIDSPVLPRETAAVNDWLTKSTKLLHSMRDHPRHNVPILGGMWGFRNALNRPLGYFLMKRLISIAVENSHTGKGFDQRVLKRILWPILKDHSYCHDSYLCKQYGGETHPFPSERTDALEYVGCPFGDNNGCGKIISFPKCPKYCRPKTHLNWTHC